MPLYLNHKPKIMGTPNFHQGWCSLWFFSQTNLGLMFVILSDVLTESWRTVLCRGLFNAAINTQWRCLATLPDQVDVLYLFIYALKNSWHSTVQSSVAKTVKASFLRQPWSHDLGSTRSLGVLAKDALRWLFLHGGSEQAANSVDTNSKKSAATLDY